MFQVLRDMANFFCNQYRYFWLASILAIPYLSYRSQQTDFNMLDGFIMYSAVFIGAFGMIQDERNGRPR